MGVDRLRRHGQEIDVAQSLKGDVPLRALQLHELIREARNHRLGAQTLAGNPVTLAGQTAQSVAARPAPAAARTGRLQQRS